MLSEARDLASELGDAEAHADAIAWRVPTFVALCDLEAARAAGQRLHINVLGLATIAPDVTPDLARATIASVVVLGALHASPAVKAALADRIR